MMRAILQGDAVEVLRDLPDSFVHCIVTSPPYWGLRDYGVDGQIGLEATPDEYVARMVAVFSEARRVLRDDGTLWLNLGDSYASQPNASQGKNGWLYGRGVDEARLKKQKIVSGLKPKDLVGIPWRVAFALQADGWFLRQDIIWHKPNPMPESVRDRCTKSHEYVFLLSKSGSYFFDSAAMQEPASGRPPGNKRNKYTEARSAGDERFQTAAGLLEIGARETRNRRSVWTVATQPYHGAHFACFPRELIRPCVRAAAPLGGVVLDPFFGAGTTGVVALEEERDFVGIELNPQYIELAEKRLAEVEAGVA